MDEQPHQQQEQEQRPQRRPRAGPTNAKHPTAPSDILPSVHPTALNPPPPAAAATNDHPRFVEAAALHNANDTVNAMSAHAVTDSSQVSGGADASALAPDKQNAGGSALWVILGPVIAGVVVAAVIFGLVMARRRRRTRATSDPPSKARGKERDKSSALDDDDLMVEMFEPPELLSSGNISGAFFNWRNATSPQPQHDNGGGGSRRGSAQFSGRSTMLGLTTILEEGSNHDHQRIKKYHGNIRRPSGKANGSMSPLRIASPNPMRGPLSLPGMRNMQVGDTPPLSPLISPTASPAPSDHTSGGGLPTAPGQIYLSAPVGRQKRKLTIPYTPQDVTRRRSLEGAW